jgi:hypothetical protein
MTTADPLAVHISSRPSARTRLIVTAATMLTLSACADLGAGGDTPDADELVSSNGLGMFNGLGMMNGLGMFNGLTGVSGIMSANGISVTNGLTGINGLSETTGLMTTDAGRRTVAYLVKCALATGDSLVKKDPFGTSYTFPGGMGLCPQWKNGGVATDRNCQNTMSACLMAHVNTAGVHVPLWLTSESPRIGWGVSPEYPKQEGTFFGNVMMTGNLTSIGMPGVNAPVAYFCEGAGITAGVVAGRLTAGATNVPYVNPYGTNVKCGSASGQVNAGPTSPGQTAPDGYKQACAGGYCFQSGEPITVWRNPSYAPVFDAAYRYGLSPLSSTGKRVDVAFGATTNGTIVQQLSSLNVDSQKFAILRGGTSWKIAMKTNTSKCFGPQGNLLANGTRIEIQDCNGTDMQAWNITADANTGAFTFKHVASNRCLDVQGGGIHDYAPLQLYDCFGANNQKFKLSSSY